MSFELDISFIVPAKNEVKTIEDCVKSIEYNAGRMNYSYEIIVVDDRSTDGTFELLNQKRFPGTILVLPEKVTGVSAVRNYAATQAKGKVLVFIDGDVVLNEDWWKFFPQAFRELDKDSQRITGSQYFVNPDDDNWIVESWFKNRKTNTYTHYINAGHMIVDHHFFYTMGKFDESLTTGEDTDFCKRARERWGSKIINNSNLVAIHLGYPQTLKDFFNRERWHGKGNWQGDNLKTKMTISIILFWFGLLGAPFVWFALGLPIGTTLGLAYAKGKTFKNSLQRIALSATLLAARGLSLIDVFTGKVSRVRG